MKSRYKTEYKTAEDVRIRAVGYRKRNPEQYKEYDKQYYEKNKEWRKQENSRCQKIRIRKYKINALEKIANYHNSSLKCWKCSENRLWCLTIGHINQNGKTDRTINGNGTQFYRKILDNERTCEDLQIECFNCNCVSYFFGKYPCELKQC